MDKQLSLETEDYASFQSYHIQLIEEVITLFQVLSSFCKQHSEQAESALARAILFTFFGAIETSFRVLASSALLANAHLEQGVPIKPENGEQPINILSFAEKRLLRQEDEILTPKWQTKRVIKYTSFEDALAGYPQIYARLFGRDFSITKSSTEWETLIKLKRIRDLGAHGNITKANPSAKSGKVTYTDLKELLVARRWYCSQLAGLPWIAGVEAQGEIRMINLLLHKVP